MNGTKDPTNRKTESSVSQQQKVKIPFIKGLTFRMSLGITLFLGLVIIANYYVTQTKGKEVVSQQVSKLNQQIGENIILKLRERLSSTESLAKALAKLSLNMPKDEGNFYRVVPEVIDQAGMEELIAGGGVWPEPFQFQENLERRSFFWGRNSEGNLQYYDDYNDPTGNGYHNEEWYVPAKYIAKGEVYWSKSYMDPYSLEPMVTCTVPMWQGDVFKGVVTIDLRLTGLSEFMSEQARVIGGYAFALDRNNRLLSFPTSLNSSFGDLKSYVQTEYPTINELARIIRGLAPIEKVLRENRSSKVLGGALSVENVEQKNVDTLARKLAEESYQINLSEARVIAGMIRYKSSVPSVVDEVEFKFDPFLDQASTARVIKMKDLGWKVVIAMPTKYSEDFVSELTDTVLSRLLILLAVMASAYMLFFNIAFLVPVNNLTQQVRRLVSREDYVTKLKVKGENELSHLANWFNIRTTQLADALDKLKQRNIDISDAREAAEQANRSKNIFLASMSHDIRTPMNAIIGMTDVLQQTRLDAEQSRYVNVINTSSQSLLSLINDIMDFSKIEANQLDLEEIPFDIRKLVDDCADIIYFQAAEKRLEFVYYVSPDINRNALGDPNRLRQILLNLATNAVKFTRSGRVELWVESIYESEDVSQLLIEVRDTGIGLTKSAQKKLFMPFSQGDSSTTRKYGGTGLGLAICKHLAELMGGSIDFRSEEGVGTTFIFKIKLKTEKKRESIERFRKVGTEGVFILGQNHNLNAVIEQYLTGASIPFKTCETVSCWLSELSAEDPKPKTTICTDISLEIDLQAVDANDRDRMAEQSFIFVGAQDELGEVPWDKLPNFVEHSQLPLPVKYDVLCDILTDGLENKSKSESLGATLSAGANGVSHSGNLNKYGDLSILVVEDNKVNQQVLMIMLGYLGLSADIANDGVEALEAIERKQYDLVLMDWQMPRMDGLEATRKIRTQFGNESPIIIAVTANAMSGDIDKCLDAGMDDYLSKPIQKEKLESMINRWVKV